jgi:hypothetical protein
MDPVDRSTTTLPADPWGLDDSPAVAASPRTIFAWGGMADGGTTGYLLTPSET